MKQKMCEPCSGLSLDWPPKSNTINCYILTLLPKVTSKDYINNPTLAITFTCLIGDLRYKELTGKGNTRVTKTHQFMRKNT